MANPTEDLGRFLRTEGLKLLQGIPGVRVLRREPKEKKDPEPSDESEDE